MLTVFNGNIERNSIGNPWPSIENISERFNLIQHSKGFQTEDGEWIISIWKRKSVAEFCKIYELKQLMES